METKERGEAQTVSGSDKQVLVTVTKIMDSFMKSEECVGCDGRMCVDCWSEENELSIDEE